MAWIAYTDRAYGEEENVSFFLTSLNENDTMAIWRSLPTSKILSVVAVIGLFGGAGGLPVMESYRTIPSPILRKFPLTTSKPFLTSALTLFALIQHIVYNKSVLKSYPRQTHVVNPLPHG